MSDQIVEPWWTVIGPDEGESLWQPLPSRGYVTLKLTPDTMPCDTFTSGVQVLPPGCHVREHGHKQNHELIFIHEVRGASTSRAANTRLSRAAQSCSVVTRDT